MRLCRSLLFKMLRYTSRFNIALVIVCLGAVLFMWNRCEVSKLEESSKRPRGTDLVRNTVSEDHRQERNQEKRGKQGKSDAEDSINDNNGESDNESYSQQEDNNPSSYQNIEVLVNGDKTIQGHLEKQEVYIPFSFIKDYFEIDGNLIMDTFGKKFHWKHTTYDYFTPSTNKYEPHGPFMWFVNYNVEMRQRVKCITGGSEVPISTQWGPEGYYYPIQIAQYGLSHYSKMMVEKNRKEIKVIDDCEKPEDQEWTKMDESSSFRNVFDQERKSRVLTFNTADSPQNGISLSLLSSSKTYVLSFDILFNSPGRVILVLEVDDTKQYNVVFETSTDIMTVKKNTVTYGIGPSKNWRRITRNLYLDMTKAFGEKLGKKDRKKKRTKKRKLRLTEIRTLTLRGKGAIDNITLAETGHHAAFLASARWLLSNQDKKGGWPIPVKRKIRPGNELKPGWYSAMAQGQAMSLLTRAYYYTKDAQYLNAASRATRLFHVKSQDHGILAIFMNRYKWYEEYPMTPSLFVLNGFIYSLMGLYDLKMALPLAKRKDAQVLFKQGMTSLRAMILMFDSGSGTIYDLRHLTMDHELNLARWDYHATHVNQLIWITQVDSDPFYKKVLERWKGYFKGIRAKHN